MKLIKTIPVKNSLAEGIQWHQKSQSVWWTDIINAQLYQYHPESDKTTIYPMPDRVGCFAFTSLQNVVVVAFANGFAFYNLKNKQIQWLEKPEEHIKGNRFNDGRVDRKGRFWAGTMVEDKQSSNQLGSLYMLDENQKCHLMLSGIEISNSLCFSINNEQLYHTDTPTRKINCFDIAYDSKQLHLNSTLVQTPSIGFPDGSCIDSENYLWNAQWGASRVVRYTPLGKEDIVIKLPVPQPSCVAIGGPTMNWLFVTTARQGLSQKELELFPSSGDIFIYQLENIKGLEESSYLIK
jgi:sugar lactone lactonase YvrE